MTNHDLPINTILCGDNCEIMRCWPSESIDLIITSPPYDNLRDYGSYDWDFFGVAWNLTRLLKKGGVIVWIVGDATMNGSETGTSARQSLHFMELGLNLYDTMIYHKINPKPLSHRRFTQSWEYSFVFSKGKPKTFNPITIISGQTKGSTLYRNQDGTQKNSHSFGGINEKKLRSNIWSYALNEKGTTHPAVMPLSLAMDHIRAWSNRDDIVLDPFSGSGTTLLAAKELNRRWVGIDIHRPYVNESIKRLSQDVFPFGDYYDSSLDDHGLQHEFNYE